MAVAATMVDDDHGVELSSSLCIQNAVITKVIVVETPNPATSTSPDTHAIDPQRHINGGDVMEAIA